MIYLLLGIVLSSLMTILFKISDKAHINSDNMILVNYVVAAGVSLVKAIREGLFQNAFQMISQADPARLLTVKSVPNTYLLLLVLGVISGAYFIIDLINIKNSIRHNGAALSALFSKFGFLITTGFAVVFWREIPSAVQTIGIVFAIAALITACGNLGESATSRPFLLLQLALFAGLAEINNKATVYYSVSERYNSFYITVIFLTAFVLALFYIVHINRRGKQRFQLSVLDVLGGICTGLPNVVSSFFILKALETIPTNIYYPTSAAGNLILTTLLSAFVFKETLSKRQIAAILIMTVSLALINL